ncbi:MAG: hypothetical protein ACYCZ0_00055 [Minisyncoccota bacterium]
MSAFMRAKMLVTEVNRVGFQNGTEFVMQDRIKCVAVAAKTYPADGSDEDNTYAKFSPGGELSLTIANPNLVGKIEPGTKFYLDFTKAE